VEKYAGDGPVMVTYGDGVSDVNIGKLLEFHKSHGKLATITTMRPFSRFGILELGPKGDVRAFKEKPQMDGWASAGFFVFEKEVFQYLNADPTCVLEREPLERLAAEGQLMAYQHEGFFFAMDTYREYLYLNELWNKGEAPWAVWRNATSIVE
jgi:glucose-1-phosphate cytidylyltransferase